MERETLQQTKKFFSRFGGIYFCGTLITFAIQFVLFWILQNTVPQWMKNHDFVMFASSMSMYLLAMPLLAFMIRRIPGEVLPKHKMSIGKWVVAFFMCYTLVYVANLAGVFTTGILGILKGEAVSNPIQDIAMGLSPFTAFFLMVVCAPIVEEYMFRKLLIDRTVQYGEKTAIVLSGLMFALFHGNLNQFVYAFVLGMFFGFIYVKTGKLIYTITLHAAVNFMGSIPALLLLNTGVFNELSSLDGNTTEMMNLLVNHSSELLLFLLYTIGIFVMLIVGIVFWALHFKKLKCAPGTITIPKGRRFQTVILNAGMILYSVFWCVQIIRQILEG